LKEELINFKLKVHQVKKPTTTTNEIKKKNSNNNRKQAITIITSLRI